MRANERMTLIFDPSSRADASALIQRLRNLCALGGGPEPAVTLLRDGLNSTDEARRAVREGSGLVLVAGTGTTVRAVAQGLVGTAAALGIIPSRKDDLLARSLGIPYDPIAALRVALGRGERKVDVGRLADGTIFTVVAGTGWGPLLPQLSSGGSHRGISEICQIAPADLLRRWKRLRSCERRIWISLDQAPARAVTVTDVLVGNLDCFGRQGRPRTAPDDGLLDVGLVTALPRKNRTTWLRGWGGEPPLRILPARSIEIRLPSVRPRQVDGTPVSPDASLVARIVPRGLSVRVPAA